MTEPFSGYLPSFFGFVPSQVFQVENPDVLEYLLVSVLLSCKIASSSKNYQNILIFRIAHRMRVSWMRRVTLSLNMDPLKRNSTSLKYSQMVIRKSIRSFPSKKVYSFIFEVDGEVLIQLH